MPSSNNSEDLRPCENSNDAHNFTRNADNRLEKLENEVYRLRSEVDKMKWQRAAAETAIERAIVRGAEALGGRYKLLQPFESAPRKGRDHRECPDTDGASTESIASNDSRLSKSPSRKPVACERTDNTARSNGKAEGCGQYTFG